MTEKRERLWSPEFIIVLLVNTLNFTGHGMVTPQMPGFLMSLGATLAAAGIIAGMLPIFALCGRPFGSVLGLKFNKKHVLVASLILTGLPTALYAIVPALIWIIPIRIVHGLMFSVASTVAIAIGASYVPRNRMGEGIGFLGLGNIIGLALGPNFGILLVDHFSLNISFVVAGIIVISAGLIVCLMRYEHTPSAPKDKSTKSRLKLSDLLAVELLSKAGFASLFMIGTGLINTFLVLLAIQREVPNIGVFFLLHAAMVVVTRSIVGRIVDRRGSSCIILPGYILAGIGMILIAWSTSLWLFLLAAVFIAIGSGGALPAIQSDCMKQLDRSRSSVASGTYMIGIDVGVAIGPIFGGMIADAFGFRVTFTAAGLVIMSGFILYLLYMRLGNKEPKLIDKGE